VKSEGRFKERGNGEGNLQSEKSWGRHGKKGMREPADFHFKREVTLQGLLYR